ncbi:MAG: transcriptional regulator [Alphaproteobacteria bacterium 16-39-46]|nr:MAG: transcriptional regulator [Alphaproteobacteria bacterium 16-39-46]OZA43676.1 MAG: transcriptional regulator [Alphaproteobacteria bacterium 17-39-52]HQS83726.1 helix-turn-helix transcriptional regulator [Alphaproteobacteria bacterium]HQS93515.1 helix-turn-helix transcriptional regulator [Alphaproteobacteria bacterium]
MQKIHTLKLLGETLRQARKDQGLTQEELASTCGVGVRFIREVEHGKDSCHIGKVLIVMQMLGLDTYTIPRGSNFNTENKS